jgi:hypothetical protein
MKRRFEEVNQSETRLCGRAAASVLGAVQWFCIDLTRPVPDQDEDVVQIQIPSSERYVRIIGPGRAYFLPDAIVDHVIALHIENVEFWSTFHDLEFSSLKYLLAINSFSSAQMIHRDEWLFPSHFPSLIYFVTDGCAPEMIDECVLGRRPHYWEPDPEFPDDKPEQPIESMIVESPYSFDIGLRPTANCELRFAVTRRVQGLGAGLVRLQGSENGWKVIVRLVNSEHAVPASKLQLFHYHIPTEIITPKEELETLNRQQNPKYVEISQHVQNASALPWKYLLNEHLLEQDFHAAQIDLNLQHVNLHSLLASVQVDGVYLERQLFEIAFIKSIGELCGQTLLRSLGYALCKKRSRNSHVTIEWSSEPLDSVRENLKSRFTHTVEERT